MGGVKMSVDVAICDMGELWWSHPVARNGSTLRARIRGLPESGFTLKKSVMANLKPILTTAVITILTVIVYRKFLAGKFGLPTVLKSDLSPLKTLKNRKNYGRQKNSESSDRERLRR